MIEVEQLSKTYGTTEAIRDVTFGVEPGEILGFLGPNGAGKTTTMRILAGYLPASSGTARVANYEVHTESMAVRQNIGYLPESPPLYPEMTVAGFLHFVGRIKGVSAGDRPQRVTSALERCGLADKRDVLIRKLSKGYRQRVGIAQAIVHDPPVIILDEPTVGLDPRQIIEVRHLIKSLAGQHTIILSTHILPEVSMTCDRVTIINRGRIVATDSPEDLRARLAGETTYEVEIQGDPRVAQQQLSTLANINRVEPMADQGATDPGRHRFLVTAPSTTDPGSVIASAVVQAGLGLFELKRDRVSLEDVFINLTAVDGVAATGETEDGAEAGCFQCRQLSSPCRSGQLSGSHRPGRKRGMTINIVIANVIAIYRRELQTYFFSPLSYVVATIFWLIGGFFLVVALLSPAGLIAQVAAADQSGFPANVDVAYEFLKGYLGLLGSLSMFILPMLSMGLYADERKLGTLELLATSPITNWAVALGKFLAVLTFYTSLLLPIMLCEAIALSASDPPIQPLVLFLGHLGLVLLAGGILSLGMFISSLTESTVLAAIMTFGLVLLLWVVDLVGQALQGGLGEAVAHLSLLRHYTEFTQGILDLSSLTLFVSYIVLGLFLTAQSIEALRFQRS